MFNTFILLKSVISVVKKIIPKFVFLIYKNTHTL